MRVKRFAAVALAGVMGMSMLAGCIRGYRCNRGSFRGRGDQDNTYSLGTS